jgi:hypothetical protein
MNADLYRSGWICCPERLGSLCRGFSNFLYPSVSFGLTIILQTRSGSEVDRIAAIGSWRGSHWGPEENRVGTARIQTAALSSYSLDRIASRNPAADRGETREGFVVSFRKSNRRDSQEGWAQVSGAFGIFGLRGGQVRLTLGVPGLRSSSEIPCEPIVSLEKASPADRCANDG